MKTVIIALIIITIASSCCLYYDYYLKNTVENINNSIDSIHYDVIKGNTENAKSKFYNLKKEWDKKENIIQLQTEHEELDIINEQFAVIASHFDHMEYDEFFENLYTLKYFINHISEKKQLNFNTIL